MSLKYYFLKLQFIDSLISKKATGNQKALANKLQISRSGLNKLLNEMREIGFPIEYSHKRQTYYYKNNGRMVKTLFKEEVTNEEMKKITGGFFATIYGTNTTADKMEKLNC
jgi:biotin operon repressor